MTSRISMLAIGLTLAFSSIMTLKGNDFDSNKKPDQTEQWKYAFEDSTQFSEPHYDDTAWDATHILGTQTEIISRKGFVWYRKEVDLKASDTNHLYVYLGNISGSDEVYINGHFIGGRGGFPPYYYATPDSPRCYRIRKSFIRRGQKNTIAVRLYKENGLVPQLSGDIGIYSLDKFSVNTIDLSGSWKFKVIDKVKCMEVDYHDGQWDNLFIPFKANNYHFRDYQGTAWYRRSFEVPNTCEEKGMILVLGKISAGDEVYVNGIRIRSTSTYDSTDDKSTDTSWSSNKKYAIPEGILKAGKNNLIAIRVFDHIQKDGLYKGPLAIFPSEEYQLFKENYCSFKHEVVE